MTFLDDLHAAKTARAPHIDVDVLLNGNLHTLRFRRMDGFDWTAETDLHPLRPGVAIDMTYGFNFRTLTKAAAPLCGVRLDDEGVEQALSEEDWNGIFAPGVLTGRYFARITDALWSLNVRQPEVAVEEAKKARSSSPKSST